MNRFQIVVLTVLLSCLGTLPALAGGPGVLKFDETSFEVSEDAGSAVIVVERSNGEDGAVSVQYAATAGTATAGQDFTAVSGTLSWSAGDESNKTFTVPVLNDGQAEGAETVVLRLSNPTGGAALDGARAQSTLVIRSNDGGTGGGGGGTGGGDDGGNGSGEIKFDQADFQVVERGGQAVITVERSRGENGTVSVQYSTAGGTATAGQDYTAVSGTLTWGPGDGSHKTFLVPIRDDAQAEGRETVRLILSNPTGGAVLDDERPTAVLSILDGALGGDDDSPGGNGASGAGKLEFAAKGYQAIEGAGTARIVVERSRGSQGAVSVRYTARAGSATAGADFTEVSGILSWAAGEGRTQAFEVPVLDDSAAEGNETVLLTLSEVTGGSVLDDRQATLTLLDDDGATTACTAGDTTLCLSGDRFRVDVVWRTTQGTGAGHAVPLNDGSGTFWFFSADNTEMLVKVINACNGFNRYWVFFAATTNVDFTVTVTDTRTGLVKQYANPAGKAAEPVQDTITFETCSQ